MLNKRLFVLGVVSALALGVALYLAMQRDTLERGSASDEKSLPDKTSEFKEHEERIDAFNVEMQKVQERKEEAKENKSAEKIEKENLLQEKLIELSESAIGDITFYGKIVDQNGNPVTGVSVQYRGHNYVYATGSGTERIVTDNEGSFVIEDARGAALTIESFKKEGYEFPDRQRFDFRGDQGYPSISDHDTENNPYVFKAWKIVAGSYPRTSHSEALFGFELGKTYSMDFTTSKTTKIKKEGALDLDLQVSFSRDDTNWNLTLVVPDGGLLESTDSYMNEAPELGYAPRIFFEGAKTDSEIRKRYYIHSRGRYYGRLELEIIPYYRSKSAIATKYVMNLDGGRNLEVKK